MLFCYVSYCFLFLLVYCVLFFYSLADELLAPDTAAGLAEQAELLAGADGLGAKSGNSGHGGGHEYTPGGNF